MSDPTQPKPQSPAGGKYWIAALLVLLMAAVCALHATKGLGMNVAVIPDETYYSYDVRLLPYDGTMYPNHLYKAIYSPLARTESDFLDIVRIQNAVIYALAVPFIFMIARLACGVPLSFLITLAALVSPISVYTLFFMPESLYFTLFWILAWALLRTRGGYRPWHGLLFGAFAGAMSFVKIHALFLVPALFVYLFLDSLASDRKGKLGKAFSHFFTTVLAFGATKVAIEYAFTGSPSLSLVGASYSGLASDSAGMDVAAFVAGIGYNLFGHVVGLSLVFGVPLLIALAWAIPRDGHDAPSPFRRLGLFVAVFLPMLVGITAVFTSLIDFSRFHSSFLQVERLQDRFYNFLYPAFLLLAGYAWTHNRESDPSRSAGKKWAAVPVALLAIYGVATSFSGYHLMYAPDCPEIATLFHFDERRIAAPVYWLCLAAIAPCCAWLYSRRAAAAAFLFVFLPVYTAATWFEDQLPFIRTHTNSPGELHLAAMRLSDYLADERGSVTIMDGSTSYGHIFAFYFDHKNVKVVPVPKETKFVDPEKITPGSKWVLIWGTAQVPPEMNKFTIDLFRDAEGFAVSLVRIADFTYSVDFTSPKYSWPVKSVESHASAARVSYAAPLPKKIHLRLEADHPAGASAPRYEVSFGDGRPPAILTASDGEWFEHVFDPSDSRESIAVKAVDGGAEGTSLLKLLVARQK